MTKLYNISFSSTMGYRAAHELKNFLQQKYGTEAIIEEKKKIYASQNV